VLRLIVDGFPSPRGRTLGEKREWLRRQADQIRRALTREPRGHDAILAAILTEPALPGSHAGLLFMDANGYPRLSGHGVMAATRIALDRGLLMPGGDSPSIVFDTAAGTVKASLEGARVTMAGVPAFVLHAGVSVKAAGRQLRADVAYGGAFHAIVDGEAAGLPVDWAHVPELSRLAVDVCRAIESTVTVAHPSDETQRGLDGVIFTAPPAAATAMLKAAAVTSGGRVDRSPSGTGIAAVMAVVDAMGLMAEDGAFTQESLSGSRFDARVAGRTMVGDVPALVAEVAGDAWIIGEHIFVLDDDDPLKFGF